MIIADTGFFVALGNRQDRHHLVAVQIVSTLQEPLITTYPVITETSYLLARMGGLASQFAFLTEVAVGTFQIFDFQRYHIARMVELMQCVMQL